MWQKIFVHSFTFLERLNQIPSSSQGPPVDAKIVLSWQTIRLIELTTAICLHLFLETIFKLDLYHNWHFFFIQLGAGPSWSWTRVEDSCCLLKDSQQCLTGSEAGAELGNCTPSKLCSISLSTLYWPHLEFSSASIIPVDQANWEIRHTWVPTSIR